MSSRFINLTKEFIVCIIVLFLKFRIMIRMLLLSFSEPEDL